MSLAAALQRRRDKEAGVLWADDISFGSSTPEPWLFLGSGMDASNLERLQQASVTHVLNVADDVPNFHEGHFIYLNLRVGDFGTDSGISRVFTDAAEFVRESRAQGGACLIHCANGSNRSATVAMAVVMQLSSSTLAAAAAHVKSRHRATCPLQDNRREL
jgi:protein-tyrosine phosphatase